MTADPDTTIQIRLATEEDAELVRTLVLEFAAHQGDLRHVQATAEDWRASLARPDVRILLAFDRDYPIGYVSTTRRFHLWIASDIIALDDIYVRPDARNRGVGLDLMNAIAALAIPEQLYHNVGSTDGQRGCAPVLPSPRWGHEHEGGLLLDTSAVTDPESSHAVARWHPEQLKRTSTSTARF